MVCDFFPHFTDNNDRFSVSYKRVPTEVPKWLLNTFGLNVITISPNDIIQAVIISLSDETTKKTLEVGKLTTLNNLTLLAMNSFYFKYKSEIISPFLECTWKDYFHINSDEVNIMTKLIF